ncbi:MAG: phosphatidylserine decarboxylase [Rhodospirillales bacterium]|nr:phosphatidylserine decarboxylase [Rhodospirillales bacterium]
MIDTVSKTLCVSIHRAGWPFIGVFAALSLLLLTQSTALGALGLVATAWCTYFFRDPERVTPNRPGLIVSPADGLVSSVSAARPPQDLGLADADRPRTRVSVFLNVFDVHINRLPVDGTIAAIRYRPGKFLNAALDKASDDNERNAVRIDVGAAGSIVVVQIAGLVARRISSWISEGEAVRAGQRFGLIRFGSRVDVYLPDGVAPLVCLGQRCIAGETVIADLFAGEPARQGERR